MTSLEVGRVALLLAKYTDMGGGALPHGIYPQRAQSNSKLSHRSWLGHQSNPHQMLAPQQGPRPALAADLLLGTEQKMSRAKNDSLTETLEPSEEAR